ncbi:MAG: trypsin-like peptidase domain-containing protein [Phycisphaerae bacterium]|nr:trypsin-like peptidase domain-containing protein [Phycisphaerae bacterium]
MRSSGAIVSIILTILVCSFCYADSIILKKGQKLTGDIVANRENKIYIDIGITVLGISKDDIADYSYSNQTEEPNEPQQNQTTPLPQIQNNGKLYSTTSATQMSIEECVEKVSPAVVKVSTPGGLGSGFFIDSQGHLITNFHVIENETRIDVTVFQKVDNGFEKMKFKKVKIIAINPFVDLALLKVEDLGDNKIAYVPLGNIKNVNTGQRAFAIGTPLGLERTVTDGVISTTSRSFEGLVYLQTNVDINPGNSGGPLFNLAGEVIGVTNMGYIFFGGLGFAIPVNYVKDFIENRDAFTYDADNPNSGFRYVQPDKRVNKADPDFLREKK